MVKNIFQKDLYLLLCISGFKNYYYAKGTILVFKDNKGLTGQLNDWGKEFSVQFDLIIKTLNGPFSHGGSWQNIIHFTIGGDRGALGRRIPALYLNKSGFLHFCSQINDDPNICTNSHKVELNKNHSIRIVQQNVGGKFIYSITMNGHLLFSIENKKPRNYEKVFVYTSNPWFDTFAPSGTLSNLKIQG